eukprot:4314377-Amphidinium_carterae.1
MVEQVPADVPDQTSEHGFQDDEVVPITQGKGGGKTKSSKSTQAYSKHLGIWLPFPPRHRGESAERQHIRWSSHVWRFRPRYGYELLGHVDGERMKRYADTKVGSPIVKECSNKKEQEERRRNCCLHRNLRKTPKSLSQTS